MRLFFSSRKIHYKILCKKKKIQSLILPEEIHPFRLLPPLSIGTASVPWLPFFITAPSWSLPQSRLWEEQEPLCCLWQTNVPSLLARSGWAVQPRWRPNWTPHLLHPRVTNLPRWTKGGWWLKGPLRWLCLCPMDALLLPLRSGWSKPALKCRRTSKMVGGINPMFSFNQRNSRRRGKIHKSSLVTCRFDDVSAEKLERFYVSNSSSNRFCHPPPQGQHGWALYFSVQEVDL